MTKKRIVQIGVFIIIVVLVVFAIVYTQSSKERSSDDKYVSPSILGRFTKDAVTSDGQECAQIGSDILRKNGSAIDAAIAALLCNGVACPQSMGLGGGFLMTIWDAETQTADYIDARETAPLAATEDMYGDNSNLSLIGGLAVAVPGEVLGYWEAHKKYGKLKWAELFEPAIALCIKGSHVTNYLARNLLRKESDIKAVPTLAETFINPETNSTWKAGDKIKRPKLAETLKLLAQEGPGIFYNGTMGDQLVAEIQAFGGIITKEDFQKYTVKWKTPITAKLGNLTMYTAPPPGSGVILTFILNLLQGIIPTNDKSVMWQRIVEAFKWGYAKRTEMGDPDYIDINDLVTNLTSIEYANAIKKLIRDDWTSQDPNYYGAVTTETRESGTAHICVLAADGSAVSVTSTINQVLGAMISSDSTGIIFNDEMDDFSSPNMTNAFGISASPANYIRPGKRPLSSMAPTIVLDENKRARLIIGGSGGTKITTGIAIAMILNLWAEYNVKEAIDARRLHHQMFPMFAQHEKGFSPTILEQLRLIGHNVTNFIGVGNGLMAISNIDGSILANSDYRRGGVVSGL